MLRATKILSDARASKDQAFTAATVAGLLGGYSFATGFPGFLGASILAFVFAVPLQCDATNKMEQAVEVVQSSVDPASVVEQRMEDAARQAKIEDC